MSRQAIISDSQLINLPQIGDRNGHITSLNNNIEIPFAVQRIFYLYDIPGGESRGAHAHKACHQFLVAVSGAFEVLLDDGVNQKTVMLRSPDVGLHIMPGIWASEINFSSGAICLVLASHAFDEADYIRDYESYLNYKK